MRRSDMACGPALHMISVDEARERILAALDALPPVRLPLLESLGLVLAERIIATEAVPPFTNSAMDGYAVRAADTQGASENRPVELRIIGEAPAGSARPHYQAEAPEVLVPGTAIRIMTGAVLPEGADAVVRFEDTDEIDSPHPKGWRPFVRIRRSVAPGENVRPAGEDIRPGSVIMEPGTCLGPAHVGLLAALGRTWVLVHPRPRVAILATGDEVVPPDRPLEPGQIRNSNSFTLACLVRQFGGVPVLIGIASDQESDLRRRLGAARGAHLILSSGGVSQGDYDRVKEYLSTYGTFEV